MITGMRHLQQQGDTLADTQGIPSTPGAPRINVSSAYVGTVNMFEKADFTRVLKTESRRANLERWIMRLELQDQTAPGEGRWPTICQCR